MKTKIKTYPSFSDPGHGWLKVPRKKLVELGILSMITGCSYQRGDYVYLEEDCDATTFAAAMREEWTDKMQSTDRQSKIRSYESFSMTDAEILTELQRLWKRLGDVPVTEDGQFLDERFLQFEKGTDVITVWHWFEDQHPDFSVAREQGARP